jgi:hypothetical protein
VPATRDRKRYQIGVLLVVGAMLLGGLEATAKQPARRLQRARDDVSKVRVKPDDVTASITTDVPMRGLIYSGLKRAKTASRSCRGGYYTKTNDRKRLCTHGPDAAPEGVDVRERPTTEALEATVGAADATAGPGSLQCYADGQSGARVQAVYARSSDVADRSSEIVPLMTRWAANADAVFNESALQTGGRRHVRWATTGACELDVKTVTLSPSGDDSLTATINELKAQGHDRTDRKYLIWLDGTRYCGIAEVKGDDQPGPANVNNFGPTYGRVDASCWGKADSVEAHELIHMLGGIQHSAPHSSGGWHCTDENDRMCLADPSTTTPLTFTCPATHEALFDCGNDDYFNTAPAPGSYLATHWNAANNVFLSADVPTSCATSVTATETTTKRKRRRGRGHQRRHTAAPPAPAAPPAVCAPA